ncbi:MAG: site-specific DNA-methyltransferase [Chthoniobacteraceae bacterium]
MADIPFDGAPRAFVGSVPVWCAHERLAPVESLVPNPRNPNRHPASQVELLSKIIAGQGFRNPIVVSLRSGFVIKGHCRLEAAKLLGMPEVPVDFQYYKNEAAEWADMVADNRIAEIAETDQDSLQSLLRELDGKIDLDLTGFDKDALGGILSSFDETTEDGAAISDPPENPITHPGDLYELGAHRLLCGDATNADDVRRLMQGQRAILFATDPPYLVGYDGTNHPGDRASANTDWSETYGVTWDETDDAKNCDLYNRFITVAVAEAVESHAAWYCWHASRRQRMVEAAWEKAGAFVHQQIIWMKSTPILTRSWYMWAHEPCFFGWIKGSKPPRETRDYERSVWEIPGISAAERPDHPTPKPLECFAIPMRQHTKTGDLCYEPFSGSGSQLIAAEQLGRVVYGMEISPAYCDVIVRRWLALGGERRVIGNGEDVTAQFIG